MTDPQPKKSDLGVRVASAVVMIAVAGTALWLGGWVWTVFVAVVATITFVELMGLVQKTNSGIFVTIVAAFVGIIYVGSAAFSLTVIGVDLVLYVLVTVVVVDVAAYFTGRSIGGPKIAPKISPSKTWSGLVGGMVAAGIWFSYLAMALAYTMADQGPLSPEIQSGALRWTGIKYFFLGAMLAVAAQAGDFLESWLKRRAGVKDSSNLIPGHGGVFDRVDGMIPVAIIFGLLHLVEQ